MRHADEPDAIGASSQLARGSLVTFASVAATAIALGAYLGVLQLLAARSADGDGASPAPVAIGQAGGHERPPS